MSQELHRNDTCPPHTTAEHLLCSNWIQSEDELGTPGAHLSVDHIISAHSFSQLRSSRQTQTAQWGQLSHAPHVTNLNTISTAGQHKLTAAQLRTILGNGASPVERCISCVEFPTSCRRHVAYAVPAVLTLPWLRSLLVVQLPHQSPTASDCWVQGCESPCAAGGQGRLLVLLQ